MKLKENKIDVTWIVIITVLFALYIVNEGTFEDWQKNLIQDTTMLLLSTTFFIWLRNLYLLISLVLFLIFFNLKLIGYPIFDHHDIDLYKSFSSMNQIVLIIGGLSFLLGVLELKGLKLFEKKINVNTFLILTGIIIYTVLFQFIIMKIY